MPSELSHLHHRRVLPQRKLVLRKPVRAKQLPFILTPQQRTNLRASVHRVQASPRVSVPELNRPISPTAAGRQQIRLERAPRKSLHSRRMLLKPVKPLRGGVLRGHGTVPYVYHVVVATTR